MSLLLVSEGFFPPALLLPCLILHQPCQLLTMPEDGFLTPMMQTPSSLLAVGRHLSKRFPSHFGKTSNRRIEANDMWGHEPLFFSLPQLPQSLETSLFSDESQWVWQSQPVLLSTIVYWNAVRICLQFKLSVPKWTYVLGPHVCSKANRIRLKFSVSPLYILVNKLLWGCVLSFFT